MMLLPVDLVKMQIPVNLKQGPRFCVSNEFPDDINAFSPWTTFEQQGSRGNENNVRIAFDLRKYTFFEKDKI